MNVGIFILPLLSLLPSNTADFIKVYGSHTPSRQRRWLWSSKNDACKDSVPYSKWNVTYQHHGDYISWHRNIKFWKSAAVTSGVNVILDSQVPGLYGATIRDIVNYYRSLGCWVYLWGGSIRDQFTQSQFKDADIETPCTADTIYAWCVNKWRAHLCRMMSPIHVMIGEEYNIHDVDVIHWSFSIFAETVNLEYTANALGYDLNGNDVVIDVTGMGKDDVCKRVIRIPVEPSRWNDWEQDLKVFRYWKLRSKGFHKAYSAMQSFIVTQFKCYSPETLKMYSCYFYFGGWYNSSMRFCHVDSRKDAITRFDKKYRPFLKADLGRYWKKFKHEMN